jgi:two-component system, cell cycle sensor histidine kinase and response regulator CckA
MHSNKSKHKSTNHNDVSCHLFQNMRYGCVYCRVICDETGRPVDFIHQEVNAGYKKVTGIQNVIGLKASAVFPDIQNSQPEFIEKHLRVAETGIPDRFEFYLEQLHKCFDISVYSLQKGYFTAIIDDITERKESEHELRKSEERFKTLFNSHSAIQAILDPDTGKVLDVNQKAADWYGWTVEELKQKYTKDINTLGPEAIISNLKTVPIRKQNKFVGCHRRADGSIRDVEIFRNKIELDGKAVIHVIINDVTDRLQDEEELRRLTRALQATNKCNEALIHSNDEMELLQMVCNIIVETGGYRMTWVGYPEHDKAKSISVVAEAGFVGKYIQNLQLSWADVPEGRGPVGIAIRTGRSSIVKNILDDPLFEIWRMEAVRHGYASLLTLPLKDESEVFGILAIYSAKPDAFDEEETTLLTSLADNLANGITMLRVHKAQVQLEAEREKLQAQLLHSQKMEMVGQLAGGIAHDFNNMLGVILGYAEMALEKKNLSLSIISDLDAIRRAALRSANLTRQLLAFARKQIALPITLDLNATVEGMLSMLKSLIGENISLDWIPTREGDLVKIDPSQLDQILVNLCVNARDAITGEGTITIQTGRLCINREDCQSGHLCNIPGDYITLAVTDNGSGIEKRHHSHIFEPFFTTKEIGKGTGLGLSTVYGIVKQNNGCITFESEWGKGTTFKINLPLYQKPNKKTIEYELSETGSIQNKKTVLLCEDQPDILSVCQRIIEQQGYLVIPAATPEKAIDIASNHTAPIDLLLTDVVMPKMNGRQLADKIQSICPAVKTLFMSGYTSDIIANHGVVEDGVNFIQKPFSGHQLIRSVQKSLDLS